ncbi:MAG: universal stress protein [Rudanella sp.]|nr:universal stress protein [Rudanella sp.]
MNTIMVATDLSASAHWATDYALELASRLRARLVIVHAYDPLPNTAPAHEWMSSTAEAEYHVAVRKLNRLRRSIIKTTKGAVGVLVIARPGSPATVIANEASTQQADLLVMGVVGSEPLKARQLGSLATDMITHAPVSMLLVPPGATFHQPKNMVLAVDLSEPVNAIAIDSALRFASLMQASLDVVCVEDEPDATEQKAARQLRDLLRHQPHTFSFLPGLDVALALADYLANHKADLIMLLPKPHSRLRTWLLESVTQEVARLSTLPVLAAV